VGSTSNPTFDEICDQCRFCMPFLRSATIRGTLGLNSSSWALTAVAIFKTASMSRSLKNLMTLARILTLSSTNFSAAGASRVYQSPLIHFSIFTNQLCPVIQRLL
jgi:hypothetical protein